MRLLHILGLLTLSAQIYAVPARFHVFRAQMSDGTFQNIRFCGDEYRSYYVNEEGFLVEKEESGCFRVTSLRPQDKEKTASVRAMRASSQDRVAIKPLGSPRIPVILVNFSDEKLTVTETARGIADYYDKYCNGTRDGILYTGAGSRGAVRDYFYFAQQSDSLFLPEFEVIGPVTLDKPMAYYGENSPSGAKDIRFSEFCSEALEQATTLVSDFKTRFDNDGNGTVDLAFFIYAGLPESDPGVTEDAIWPKEMIRPMTINGVTVSVTACCSELSKGSSGNQPSGIGTMCHEVSHALGLPDEYDTNYTALGMSYWSLMDSGNYCDNGKTPCGLTAYERDLLGWRPLTVLERSTTVRLRPLEAGGVGYKVVNEANPDEYYVLENRQHVGWDNGLMKLGHGMLVVHVDYDETAWKNNMLNTNATHQRMSFIPANNRYVGPYNAESSADLLNALGGQPYPGTEGNTALTNETTPASLVFTGTRMNKPITQIRELENGDIVLKYMPKGRLEAPVVETAVEVASNSFKFSWSPSENATFYTVKVYGISGDGQWTEHPVFIADSLSGTSCTVLLDDTSHQSYAYGVSALDDEYEDSEFSDYGYVRLTADAVRQVGTEEDANVEVYSLHGVLLARSREAMSNLVPGIYVLRAEGKAVKVVIK
jgi:M6 family metalloprotease-like protein